ncbi:MAG: U32 family peptidase [Paludibacteraceae bacterium]|nr:U32 family peptidase [Paludibacteraceae bacterium]MBQ8714577.1 U32 family peptidase [Prevotella sp.]
MTTLELLAPAKNLACGMAAVDHGADAVYIGAQRFGARAAAGNSVDDIRQLCDYAHPFGVKVYVTVNTILYDDELEATEQLIRQLYDAGVDAILVQDMGVLRMDLPPIALHASTQTDNRTAEKVHWLKELGFQRVVLARELSVNEIAAIHLEVPDMNLEVFVHGALCVSYSGLCYASQYCFGRSANRGACAQFCRMKFDLLDADGNELEHQRHLLSLKDMNQSDHLEELIEAGATSFKIEGRLKEVGYVKNVVAAYSQRLDAFVARHPDCYCRASKGHCTYTFTPNLKKTFNRGFTTYFLHGRQPDVFSPDTPKAMGEYVGYVKEIRRDSFNVAGTAAFANGDGLCFINQKRELEGFRVNRAEGNRLYPHEMPRYLHAGMALYRNSDQEFERLLSKQSGERKIPLVMHLRATDNGFALSADGVEVCITCEHQQAEKPQRENIFRQLSRLGGTPYKCSRVELPDDFNYFIPSSLLAELRRRLVESAVFEGRRCRLQGSKVSPSRVEGAAFAGQRYGLPYLYNISNRQARVFYEEQGLSDMIPAFEVSRPRGEALLMQCRHCLRYSLGCCVKHGGGKPQWKEPLFLRLGDGRRFRLDFDCRNCQMNVYAAD